MHPLLKIQDLNISYTSSYGLGEKSQGARPSGPRRRFSSFSKEHTAPADSATHLTTFSPWVINNLSLEIYKGEFLAVIGGSGSGKSVLAEAVLGLFDNNEEVSGEIYFDGKMCDAPQLEKLRRHEIAYVPQGIDALDPLMRVGKQVQLCTDCTQARSRQRELFARYNLGANVERMYPHQLSGGMARRVLMCCALMSEPSLLIADEPTPGMDENLARQAMQDMRNFADSGGAVLLITHDVSLAAEYADKLSIVADGTVVETISTGEFSHRDNLKHEFTRALWRAVPEHGLLENLNMESHV